jgi:peptide chain release factor 1
MSKIKTGIGWPHDVTKKDLVIEPVRGSGPGGQHRNKTYSGIRITHIPTGISTRCDEERMQSQNLKTAFKKLCDKLIPIMKKSAKVNIVKQRFEEERIRTYNQKDQRVVDTRIESKIFNYDNVVFKDGLENIISDLIKKKD